MKRIAIQTEGFDLGAVESWLTAGRSELGAMVSFVGRVRDFSDRPGVRALTLEHYPGMTEAVLDALADEASTRWRLGGVAIIHRVGRLSPGDEIVLVAVACAHRKAAFEACEFIIDRLKTQAPFWKKEHSDEGDRWVGERMSDRWASERWEGP
ncbi:molybdopterin synthase catalytic subunit MoaE [Halotalea alkalilenta]|uniref:Molybdopterin synthase catalytic subunit n=1 Tax=Halotalea alkalilenta TaxID=376489 RepID=A0A172YEZ4_9GAMM|nr:molybdopterin synthase catalytic subunit MoaE [Halotalea alkalilenta]ANF57652.1 molybdenum cofactor biosynthesis protein MoaE [Halotalea alkalilenta]